MTTTLEVKALSPAVASAIEDLRGDFEPPEFEVEPDDQGGARVRFGPVELGEQYSQRESWIGAHIPAQVPYADVYPIFLRGDLARVDGRALVAPLTAGHNFMGREAVQVSRRSNNRDAAVETVKLKFKKVLEWVNAQ